LPKASSTDARFVHGRVDGETGTAVLPGGTDIAPGTLSAVSGRSMSLGVTACDGAKTDQDDPQVERNPRTREAGMILVRPRAWWFNKVPLSVILVLLLLDGRPLSVDAVIVLAMVALTVSAAGNYGYALNELFDIEEDAHSSRVNAAAAVGGRRMWAIIGASALCAEVFATAVAGAPGAILTFLELCLPLGYSAPPLRIKERKWLGVCVDGLAAHVYPALLGLLAVTHWTLRPVATALAVCVTVWAAAAGLRGILSHQLHTADQDRNAGLRTVVHDFGNARVERFIVATVLPFEVAAFGGGLISSNAGAVLWLFVALYLIYEIFTTTKGLLRVTVFRPAGQRYLPFVEESFYKAWGPVVLALDAARADLAYLLVIPVYALLFPAHLRGELHRLRLVMAVSRSIEPGSLPPVPMEKTDLRERYPQPLDETVIPAERLLRDPSVIHAEIPPRGL
jgi:4-hydroxybenzoate polyprenyltransferase